MRELAFKLVYELEVQKENSEEQFEIFIQNNEVIEESVKDYLKNISNGIYNNNEEMNKLIEKNLKDNWSINRISKINISLIKLAIYEMVYNKLPYKVAINEVVELAKKYADESAPVFINGILASVVKEKNLNGDINKLEANQMEIVESNYDLNKILDELKRLALIRIGDKNLDLRCNFAPNIPSLLLGDPDKIKSIILNLLTNAIKYTDSGVIYFSVDCENVKDRSNLVIRVKDTGRGMSPDQLDNLFTKFNRLDGDMDSNIEGTGLGLAITKSLVDLFDGSIDVDSTLGEGSTFTVKLSQKIVEYKDNTVDSTSIEEVL